MKGSKYFISMLFLSGVIIGAILTSPVKDIKNSAWLADKPKQEDQRLNKLAQRLNVLEMKWNDRENHFEAENSGKDFSFKNKDGVELGIIDQYGSVKEIETPDVGCVLFDTGNTLMVKFANGDVCQIAGGGY